MPALEPLQDWETKLFRKLGKNVSGYLVLSPHGLGKVRYSDPFIKGKVPVVFTDGNKILVAKERLTIVTVLIDKTPEKDE